MSTTYNEEILFTSSLEKMCGGGWGLKNQWIIKYKKRQNTTERTAANWRKNNIFKYIL